MKVRVLLVDTNISSYPIYNFLENEGYDVYVVGGKEDDFLAKYSNKYINMDYSNIDGMLDCIDELSINYLVPGCNDWSYSVCAKINEARGFFGIEPPKVDAIINNKGLFRGLAKQLNLPVPQVYSEEQSTIQGSVIVKPVDSYSGQGTTVIHGDKPTLLEDAINRARAVSRSNDIVIEDFIEGQLYSYSAFLVNQEVVVAHIVEEHGTANPFVVDTSRVKYDLPRSLVREIGQAIGRMAKNLELKDGLVHVQLILKGNSFWLIEVTRRCPGDLYSHLIQLSTGYPYAENYTRPFLGLDINRSWSSDNPRWITRHTISQPSSSKLLSLQFSIPLKISDYFSLAMSGDQIERSPKSRVGLLFAESDSLTEQDTLFNKILDREIYLIK